MLQVRYEDLLADPVAQVRRVLTFVGVSFEADAAFPGLLDGLSLKSRQEPWTQRWTPQQLERVMRLQGDTLARWGYPT